MPQRLPLQKDAGKFKKELYLDNGYGYNKVNAKIIEPYTPPAPQPRVKELKILNAPSHLQGFGFSAYKCKLTLLFVGQASYNEYLSMCGWTHKFMDERGAVYLGSLTGIDTDVLEAGRRYRVKIDLLLVKKDSYDRGSRFEYQDIAGHWAEDDIANLANKGIITVITRDGQPVLNFRPNDTVTRAEFVVFLNRTMQFIEKVLGR